MYCRHCGSELKEMAVICSACGHGVNDEAEAPSPGPAPRWSWFTMFVTLGVVVTLLLIAIIAGL